MTETYDLVTSCLAEVALWCLCLLGNTGNMFRIDAVLGILSVARELDLSSIGHYVLTVRATDNEIGRASCRERV